MSTGPELDLRNSRGEVAPVVSSTDAKKGLGGVIDTALSAGVVGITRNGTVKAVVLSVDEYQRLAQSTRRSPAMETLRNDFDAMFERMQAPEWDAGMQSVMNAPAAELGRAAVAVARKRKQSSTR